MFFDTFCNTISSIIYFESLKIIRHF